MPVGWKKVGQQRPVVAARSSREVSRFTAAEESDRAVDREVRAEEKAS